jgi:tetrachlorobenzoquinone reductase
MAISEAPVKVRVSAVSRETDDINLLELRPVSGDLPAFSAGAHVDLHLSNGLVRSYSLTNPAGERHRYVIGVKKEPLGRGGSRFIHEQLHAGEETTVSPPRNTFALCEDAPSSVLIAGGIGITPLISMANHGSCIMRHAASAPPASFPGWPNSDRGFSSTFRPGWSAKPRG